MYDKPLYTIKTLKVKWKFNIILQKLKSYNSRNYWVDSIN